MPFSLLVCASPQREVSLDDAQGTALQGMFLHLIRAVDPVLSAKLHDDNMFRPYTLSPLGVGEAGKRFESFRLPHQESLAGGTPCFFRVTLLDDAIFPTFARYFLERAEPGFRLGANEFTVTDVQVTPDSHHAWSQMRSYDDLISQAATQHRRRIRLRFLTPTSFRNGDVDIALPIPRLVFLSYLKRFQEYHPFVFFPDFVQQAELCLGVEDLRNLHTERIRSKRITLTGFVGDVEFVIDKNASPEFVKQAHLLADFAFFCGTGRKTTIGMGQTVCLSASSR